MTYKEFLETYPPGVAEAEKVRKMNQKAFDKWYADNQETPIHRQRVIDEARRIAEENRIKWWH